MKPFVQYPIHQHNEALIADDKQNFVPFFTTSGPIIFDTIIINGDDLVRVYKDKDGRIIKGMQCAIIMFDATCRLTYRKIPIWHSDLIRLFGSIPIVIVATMGEDTVISENFTFHCKKGIPLYELKHPVDGLKPFLWLARKLSLQNDLFFVVDHPCYPPVKAYQAHQNDLALQAANCALPEEDDINL